MEKDFISGAVGALFCTFAGQPFDTVKARMQVSKQYAGTVDCAIRTVKGEGGLALFKGFTPAYASAAIENTVLWTIHGLFLRNLVSSNNEDSAFRKATLGALSGFFSGSAIGPAEIIKVRLQTLHSVAGTTSAVGPLHVIRELWKTEGIKGFTRGLVPVRLCIALNIPLLRFEFRITALDERRTILFRVFWVL
mmetsp:Transcript_12953/g.16815  ORF Transcript_12953/g.16815 Transcript_12953/m.16815 type:complete len:193 (-) Transcript_12953:686-1264(-)